MFLLNHPTPGGCRSGSFSLQVSVRSELTHNSLGRRKDQLHVVNFMWHSKSLIVLLNVVFVSFVTGAVA